MDVRAVLCDARLQNITWQRRRRDQRHAAVNYVHQAVTGRDVDFSAGTGANTPFVVICLLIGEHIPTAL